MKSQTDQNIKQNNISDIDAIFPQLKQHQSHNPYNEKVNSCH